MSYIAHLMFLISYFVFSNGIFHIQAEVRCRDGQVPFPENVCKQFDEVLFILEGDGFLLGLTSNQF